MVKRNNLLMWGSLFGPSATWLAYLLTSFTVAAYACERGDDWIMQGLTFCAVVLSAGFLWGGGSAYKRFKESENQSGIFICVISFLLGALIVLILFASELSNHLVRPCL